jgi:hypothetical protein
MADRQEVTTTGTTHGTAAIGTTILGSGHGDEVGRHGADQRDNASSISLSVAAGET